jgi:2-oxoglutarate ferredoxin oxidoreductase subunit delta
VIALSEEINSRGYHTALLTDAENCTGCCFCAQVCPDAALEVFLARDEARYDDDNDD